MISLSCFVWKHSGANSTYSCGSYSLPVFPRTMVLSCRLIFCYSIIFPAAMDLHFPWRFLFVKQGLHWLQSIHLLTKECYLRQNLNLNTFCMVFCLDLLLLDLYLICCHSHHFMSVLLSRRRKNIPTCVYNYPKSNRRPFTYTKTANSCFIWTKWCG